MLLENIFYCHAYKNSDDITGLNDLNVQTQLSILAEQYQTRKLQVISRKSLVVHVSRKSQIASQNCPPGLP